MNRAGDRVTDAMADLAPWHYRKQKPEIVKNLPKPVAEEEVSDARTIEYFKWARQQEEERIQQEITAHKELENLTADEIRALFEAERSKLDAQTADERHFNSAATFRAEEPLYISTPTNDKRMLDWLEARGYRGDSPEELHEAFTALSSAGLLKTNPRPITARPELTQEDLETMPLEELKELAEREMRGERVTNIRIVGQRR